MYTNIIVYIIVYTNCIQYNITAIISISYSLFTDYKLLVRVYIIL